MHPNLNLEAAAGALALLGTYLLLAVPGLVFAHALLRRRWRRALTALSAGLCLVGLYAALLLAFCLASGEKLLPAAAEKYFCEVDCHLAYSVVGVRRAKTPGGATAAGEFYVVTPRTRFDETNISPARGGRAGCPH